MVPTAPDAPKTSTVAPRFAGSSFTPLHCRQPSRCRGSSFSQRERLGHASRVRRTTHRVLRVEAALAITELVRVHTIANAKPSHTGAERSDNARAVDTGDQRKFRSARSFPFTLADRRVPHPDARGVDFDQHFMRSRLRSRHLVNLEERRRTESADRGRLHSRLFIVHALLAGEGTVLERMVSAKLNNGRTQILTHAARP